MPFRSKLTSLFSTLLLALLLAMAAHAQGQVSFQYFYDELGQLTKVVDSTGNVIEYVYDPVGNILEIKRSSTSGLAIFNFTPLSGPVTTKITIQGQGFSANPSDNTVTFNGTSAEVSAATLTTLVATVPLGATTGPIAVTVSGVTVESSQNFTVTQVPVITSVVPVSALSGTTVPSLQVAGINLTGATFSFVPAFVPPAVTVNSTSINPSGTSAVLSLTIRASVAGPFVLVATNAQGSSDASSSAGNTLNVVDSSNQNVDSDGDTFPDGLEVALGSNPFDANSVPNPNSHITEAVEQTFSVVNGAGPEPSINEAVSQTFSVVNTTDPGQSSPIGEATGQTFSVLNGENPGQPTPVTEAVSQTFSVGNSTDPGQSSPVTEAVSQTFSVGNSTDPGQSSPVTEATGQTFLVRNNTNPGQSSPVTEAVSPTFSVQNQP